MYSSHIPWQLKLAYSTWGVTRLSSGQVFQFLVSHDRGWEIIGEVPKLNFDIKFTKNLICSTPSHNQKAVVEQNRSTTDH